MWTPSTLNHQLLRTSLKKEPEVARVLPSPCCSLAGSEQKAHVCCQRTFHWGVLVGRRGLLLLPWATQEPHSLPSPAKACLSASSWLTQPEELAGQVGLFLPLAASLEYRNGVHNLFCFSSLFLLSSFAGLTSSWKVPSPAASYNQHPGSRPAGLPGPVILGVVG